MDSVTKQTTGDNTMLLVKIGGGGSINLAGIISDLKNLDEQFIIVHGANALRDQLAEQLHIEKEILTSVSGYSSVKSTDDMIDLLLMSYAGLRNKRIVELLRMNGINAIGLSGIDGGLIEGKRNKGIKSVVNGKRVLIRDNSGKPQKINHNLLRLLLDNGYFPVITVPITDEDNRLINSENDDIVGLLVQNLSFTKVIMFIEERGLLRDRNQLDSLIKQINHIELDKWENETTGRMKRKLYAIQQMLHEHGPTIVISDGRSEFPVSNALAGIGTTIKW